MKFPCRNVAWGTIIRQGGMGFLLGATANLGHAPFDAAGFAALFVLPLFFFFVLRATTIRAAIWRGWCFHFGYHVFGLYWIANALLVDGDRFAWMLPFAMAGLPAVLALYGAAASACAWRWGGRGWRGCVNLALALFVGEWLRGHLFTGFPWNLFGSGWLAADLAFGQSASIFGAYGLTLLTLLLAAGVAAMGLDRGRQSGALLGGAGVVALGLMLWGQARLTQHPPIPTTTQLRIVQPNIPQRIKWSPTAQAENWQRLLTLSAQAAAKPLAAIIWPETAVTFLLAEHVTRRLELASLLSASTLLITGAPRRQYQSDGTARYTNALLALDQTAHVIGHYDKHHLVPFGEYVPLRGFAPVAALASGVGDFAAGIGPMTLQFGSLPAFSPLICYEVIFPAAVTPRLGPQPAWILNLTNDGWYGRSSGPYQHLAQSRWRAVEEGVPLIRAANTGVSAVIDPLGRILAQQPLETVGIMDVALPQNLPERTIFARFGHGIIWIIFVLLGVGTNLRRQKTIFGS